MDARVAPERIAQVAAGAAAWFAAVPALGCAIGNGATCLQTSTLLLGSLLVARLLGGSPDGCVARGIGLGALLGALNSVSTAVLLVLFFPDGELSSIVIGILGTSYGAAVGLVYGLAFGLLVSAVHPLGRRRRFRSSDHAIVYTGMWLCGVAALVAIASHWDAVPLGMFGVALAAFGAGRELRRQRFVEAVKRGRLPEWQIVPFEPSVVGLTLAPYVRLHDSVEPYVLTWCPPLEDAYRQRRLPIPVALVPAPGE